MTRWLKKPAFWLIITPFLLLGAVFVINPFLMDAGFCPLPTWFEVSHGVFPSVISKWYVYVAGIIAMEVTLGYVWLVISGLYHEIVGNNATGRRKLFLSVPFIALVLAAALIFGGLSLISALGIEVGNGGKVLAISIFVVSALLVLGSAIWLFVVSILQYKRDDERHDRWLGTFASSLLVAIPLLLILIGGALIGSLGEARSTGSSFAPTQMSADAGSGGNIGLSVGGANDADNFRENINNCFLPAPTDITYEGLFYDYRFDTSNQTNCTGVFCPQYESAVTKDPFSGETENYLSVGLGSNISQSDFERPPLNLAIVLDVSGSMGSTFDRYYYDQFRSPEESEQDNIDWDKQKMEVAKEAIKGVAEQLRPEDRLALVTYNSDAQTLAELETISDRPTREITNIANRMSPGGGTNMEAGIEEGTQLFDKLQPNQKEGRENRIIFLTDAQPNTGELDESDLYQQAKRNASTGLHTTFFGIGVDFNTKLIEGITNNLRGANYFAVHSPKDFNKRLNEEFEYFSAPLAYNVSLSIDGGDYEIQKIYGSPEDGQSSDEVLKVKTLFPSPTTDGQSRGGVILAEMDKQNNSGDPTELTATYETRDGTTATNSQTVQWENSEPSQNMNKAILLSRFARLMKNWLADEHSRRGDPEKTIYVPVRNAVDYYRDGGLPPLTERRIGGRSVRYIEQELSRWERLSRRLAVSDDYRELFRDFRDHFKQTAKNLDSDQLDRELKILDNLIQAPTPSRIPDEGASNEYRYR